MKVSIISIGTEKGILLCESILEKYKISDTVELLLENEHMILKPVIHSREGWEESFAEMHENGDDKLLIDSVFEDENY